MGESLRPCEAFWRRALAELVGRAPVTPCADFFRSQKFADLDADLHHLDRLEERLGLPRREGTGCPM